MDAKEIERKYLALVKKNQKRQEKIARDRQEFVALVKDHCTHPEEYQYHWKESCDDGYGRWYDLKRRRCYICNKQFHSYGVDWCETKDEK